MTARILVVDDIPTNVKLLEARLMAEYFQVLTASNGVEALQICQNGLCDIVLLDVMMPGMNGFEVCTELKSNKETMHLPVVMVTALDSPEDKIRGLEAGADDFLTKPVNDLALITRVKSLARLKMLTDDLRLRASEGVVLADSELLVASVNTQGTIRSRVAVVEDNAEACSRVVAALSSDSIVEAITNPNEALLRVADGDFDLAVISGDLSGQDTLRLCSHIRSVEKTRSLPLILFASRGQDNLISRALEMGVNDYIIAPLDTHELRARVRTQLRRKNYNDMLRDSVKQSLELAVKDPLTSLYNRRYFENHFRKLLDASNEKQTPLSAIVCDIDHFKSVNDKFGHDVGDQVIREVANRISKNVRQVDLACRFGGEEFVVLMPDTDIQFAELVCERIRREIEEHPVYANGGAVQVPITISVGIAAKQSDADTTETLFKRADSALYDAKRSGRNRIVLAA